MSHTHWLESLSRGYRPARCVVRRPRPRTAVTAAFEALEDRTLLTAYVVDSLDDGPPSADGQLTLREALIAANTDTAADDAEAGDADGDTITFAAGLVGTILLTEGELVIEDDVSIDGGGDITIDAGGASRVFLIDTAGAAGSESDVSIADLTITGGDATGELSNLDGGGVHITADEDITLSSVLVLGNLAELGGGIYNAGRLVVDASSSVAGNIADNGGGIYNDGGTLRVLESTVSDNSAVGATGDGGGIYSSDGNVIVFRSIVELNDAIRAGGGVEVVTGRFVLDHSIVRDNVAIGLANPGNGGGLHVADADAETIVYRTTVRSNSAATEGGGLWNQAGSRMILDQSIVDSNDAAGDAAHDGGGGIFNNGGQVLAVKSVINGNAASGTLGSGGGIFSADGQVIVFQTTVADNVANRAGGGVELVTGRVVFDKSLIDRNTASQNGGGLHVTGADAETIVYLTEVRRGVAALEGGGLWNQAGSRMVLDQAVIRANVAAGNAADDGGGGIFNNGGDLLVSRSTVEKNEATGALGSGGGILSTDGTVTLFVSLLADNIANRAGGGVELVTGDLISDRSRLNGNIAGPAGLGSPGNGGGLHISGAAAFAHLFLSEVRNNVAATEGGGLWNQSGSTMLVNQTVVSSNIAAGAAADDGGGGIFNNGGALTLFRATLANNEATGAAGAGGGLFLAALGDVTIEQSSISQNAAAGNGGGVYNDADGLEITETDVFFNTAGDGGGIFTDFGAETTIDDLEKVFMNDPNDFAGLGDVVEVV